LRLYALFQVIQGRLADWLIEELSGMRKQSFQLIVWNRRFAVARRQQRQSFALRSARNFSTFGERTNPAGTTLRSSSADALVDRTAKRSIASLVTTRGFIRAPF
jgi:hypothetical protein